MRRSIRAVTLALILFLLTPALAQAAATPTPPPIAVRQEVLEPPAIIQDVLDIAYNEWQTLNGKKLKKVNKYTEWRGKGIGFGWCGGFITWCMMEAGVPMDELEVLRDRAKLTGSGFDPREGVYHVKEASVGKLLRGYQLMDRSTNVPQKGYLLVYGCSYNKTIHVALVYDVEPLGEGRFRLTTLEGNMASRVKMYIHDYDMNTPEREKNLSEPPAEARLLPVTDCLQYDVPASTPNGSSGGKKYPYYVNCFLMPWLPEE